MKPVTPKSWQQCARYYLHEQWAKVDRDFLTKFSGEVTCSDLHDLCVKYSVARTIPGYIETLGVEEKYRAFAEMLNKYRDVTVTRANAAEIVDREVVNLRRLYAGASLWSAISKALWMMKKYPVIIYDNYAWKGLQRMKLNPGEKTYREFFDSWFRFFEQEGTREGLDGAIEWLAGMPETRHLLERLRVDPAELNSLWFRSRVADMKLCIHGDAPWLEE